MKTSQLIFRASVLCALGLASISGYAQTAKAQAAMDKAIVASFRDEGIISVASITQDETQALCSDPKMATGKAGAKQRAAIEAANMETILPPYDGVYLGDWKEGEKVAQSGRGATWTDKSSAVNGGGCYNCHQISKAEVSHGTIGPSLLGYCKTRGNSAAVVEYTWGKMYNAKAYNACSAMPRIGHFNLLTEKQMKDVMALLLDPASPVNQ